jgi:tetratricopeptide (TPR) repeat protein
MHADLPPSLNWIHPSPTTKVERILCLSELSGTLDYVGDMGQGIPAAEQAVSLARCFYGADTRHPVTALCLTALGYHVKNRDHGEALGLHREALVMRTEVLGKRHTEVALSLQQCGISLMGLARYDEAEDMFTQSLAIRVDSLGEAHPLVANTQRQFADLYRAWGKGAQSMHHLRILLSIAPQIGWAPGHKKLRAAGRDLADLLREGGGDEGEAAALEEKYVNVA